MLPELCRASLDERIRRMPGDAIISSPIAVITHALTIDVPTLDVPTLDVPTLDVWPWIVQIGANRAGWYAWDRIDNGGVPSAERIVSELQQIAVGGDILPAVPGATTAFVVNEVIPGRALVLTVPLRADTLASPRTLAAASELSRVSWALVLEPADSGHTRLISRGRISHQWLSAEGALDAVTPGKPLFIERIYSLMAHMPRPLLYWMAGSGHYVMESRMLRGIKRRAEERARAKQRYVFQGANDVPWG